MEITYDAEADALYIRFLRGPVVTKLVDEGIAVDYLENGDVAGIEVLDALRRADALPDFANVALSDITHPRHKSRAKGPGSPRRKAG